jgi:hypothetical protein
MYYYLPLFVLPTVNSVNLTQANVAQGTNVAIGSPFAVQTLAQVGSNSAVINQGR